MVGGFSYYDVLGVDPSASDDAIRAAYRATIIKYHPDVNKAPNATRLAAMLNEAYETLSDPDKRTSYDAHLGSSPLTSNENTSEEEARPLLACDLCGKVFVHLRVAVFYRVWSIILYTQMNPVGGVFCPHCRSALAWRTALFSALWGPWGLPWGVLYTIRALYAAIRGGEQPRAQNAQLLRHQATAFALRGHMNEAFTNFMCSQEFECVPTVSEILTSSTFKGCCRLPTTRWLRGQAVAAFACLIPFAMAFALFESSLFSEPEKSNLAAATKATSDQASTSSDPTRLEGLMKTCYAPAPKNESGEIGPNAAYSACGEALANIDDMHAHATTPEDREKYSLTEAVTQLYAAIPALNLGKESEARTLLDQGTSTLKYLSASAAQPEIRKQAQTWYDCVHSKKCDK